ncbi:ABC transporter permease [Nocardia sp. NPDC051570]|uniref:ABC transporter permease n=1 Tax=Nocardia sp. NPDC051570 TaxID=3364324 RepID=UPI00379925CD
MLRYLLEKILSALFVLWAAFTASFGLLYVLPSDAVAIKVQGLEHATVDPIEVQQLRAQFGLDGPWWQQYLRLLWHALHGNLGISVQTGAPVADMVGHALPNTASIAVAGLVLAVVFGTALALAAAYAEWKPLRRALLQTPAMAISVPPFWLGLMLIHLVSFRWRVLPAFGDQGLRSVVLPAITIAVPTAAVIAQVLGRSLRTAMAAPYADTARAKGASRARVVLRHAFRNATMPAITTTGLIAGSLLVETVTVETVFSRAGIGRLTATAVANQDVPVVLGVVLFAAFVFVLVNLLVDLVHPLVDPRVVSRSRLREMEA